MTLSEWRDLKRAEAQSICADPVLRQTRPHLVGYARAHLSKTTGTPHLTLVHPRPTLRVIAGGRA